MAEVERPGEPSLSFPNSAGNAIWRPSLCCDRLRTAKGGRGSGSPVRSGRRGDMSFEGMLYESPHWRQKMFGDVHRLGHGPIAFVLRIGCLLAIIGSFSLSGREAHAGSSISFMDLPY